MFDDPHLNAEGGLIDLTLPDGQDTRLPALPLEFDETRPQLDANPPKAGEQTRGILEDLALDPATIDQLIRDNIISAPSE